MNNVVISGNVVRNAVLRATSTGKQVCDVRFAIREDRKPDTAESTFVDLTIWGERAEKLTPHLTKGKSLLVNGRLEVRDTTKGDKKYRDVKVVVNEIEFLSKKEKSATVDNSGEGEGKIPF